MKSNGGKFCAKLFLFAISWAYLPMASKLGASHLKQSRHYGKFHLMKCRKHSRCFALNFPPFLILL